MKKLLGLFFGLFLVFFISGAVSATTWTGTYAPEESPLFLSASQQGVDSSHDFSLNITEDGFDPGLFGWGGDTVLTYTVDLYASDDLNFSPGGWHQPWDVDRWGGEGETLTVATNTLLFGPQEPQSYEVDIFNDIGYTSWTGLLQLNVTGHVFLNLEATQGDLYFWGAKITASDSAPVPEAATMLLFGIGLLGLASVTRRKK